MKDFQDLLALALVGTSRGTLPTPAGTPLADTLNAVQGDPEGVLLSRAALAGMVQLAGQSAQPLNQDVPAPAPAETRPEAPQRVTRHLSGVIGTPLLSEWLHLCAQAGWRVPPKHLPALLDLARYDTSLRETLRPVLGERGAWLSQFNPEWRFFQGYSTPAAFNEDAWLEAGEAQKENLFGALLDSDAAAARQFLLQQFKTEKAGVRGRLLNLLAQRWTPEHAVLESLLEETLSDRSSDVRERARLLLQQLPASAYNARMAGRIQAMLQPEKVGLLGKLTGQHKFSLHLHLPEQPDADAKRDQVEPVDQKAKDPARKHLCGMLQNTHPVALAETLKLTPAELVNLFKSLDAHNALALSARLVRDIPTAQALLPHFGLDTDLLELAAPDKLLRYLLAELRKPAPDVSQVSRMLAAVPVPWSAELSSELLNLLLARVYLVEDYRSWDYTLDRLMQEAAQHSDPQISLPDPVPTDDEKLDYYAKSARKSFNDMLQQLGLRATLWRDFQAAREGAGTP